MTDDASRERRSAGFLLIEVVVALAIVALAFGYGFRSLSGALDRLGVDHQASAALSLAQSTLDRVGADIALDRGEVTGSTPAGLTWAVETAPYASVNTPAAGVLVGYVVRVTVAWKDRGRPRQVLLSTVRLARKGPG